jgi:hypothetical protein
MSPAPAMSPAIWNSLEVVKLLIAALTPVAVAVFGLWISRHLKRVEALQWANQKVIEKRLAVYSELAPLLNDLYCYFDYIGDWKMKDPVSVLALKRSRDRLVHVNAPLFSERFRTADARFIDLHFIPGPLDEYASTAKIKTDLNGRKELYRVRGEPWDTQWDSYFASRADTTARKAILDGYWTMMGVFARELAVDLKGAA